MQLKANAILQNGKYAITSNLGQGGFGITYKATQRALDREVAIKEFYMSKICIRDEATSKVLLSSSNSADLWNGFKMKFIKEAKTIASLSHPNVIKIFDVFEENNTAYYAMEYIPGGSLNSMVKDNGALPENKAISIITEVGNALAYIHSKNILHLDIKPDNIMMRDNKIPTIIDFGISKRYDKSGNQTSMMQVGKSRGYAPIEQYKEGGLSSFSPATDVYSLAATLYFLLAGHRPPEPGEIYDNGLPLILDVSGETMEGILKGMALKRAERPQTVTDFLRFFKKTNNEKKNEFDVDSFRSLIATLEMENNLKEAYNRCLDNIQDGNDVEFCKEKKSELIKRMKRQNSRHNIVVILIYIAVSVLLAIISALIQ